MKKIELKFNPRGLVPAIVQSAGAGKVLMLAWMNPETIELTRKTGYTHFYSRSRGKIWKKGDESGNTQKVKKMEYDCDADTLLITVEPAGPACHTGKETCFFEEISAGDELVKPEPPDNENLLDRLYQVIQQRKMELPEGSYVASLFKKGEAGYLKKIGEEAVEFVIGCKNRDREEIVYEAADLIFHMMVALAAQDIPPGEVLTELKKRFK